MMVSRAGITLSLFAFLGAGAALADCPGGIVLVSCPMANGTKYLETCLMEDRVLYAFTGGVAENAFVLDRPVTEVDMTPWPGIGRTIWEDFTFTNGDYAYQVHYGFDRLSEESEMFGGVTVKKGEVEIATLSCDPGTVNSAGFGLPLFDAKEAAGQLWSFEMREWVSRP